MLRTPLITCITLFAACAEPAPPRTLADVEVVVDAYAAAWNERDADARAGLIADAWADDGRYLDPTIAGEGRDGLADVIDAFIATGIGTIEVASGVDLHHDQVRFAWEVFDAGGAVVAVGMDHGVLARDGRLQSITGYFGPLPEATALAPVYAALFAAGGAPDAATREQLLAKAVTDDVAYVGPSGTADGRAALGELLASGRVAASGVDVHGARFRVAWQVEGDPNAVGIYFGTLADDGRIAALTEFAGPLPPLP